VIPVRKALVESVVRPVGAENVAYRVSPVHGDRRAHSALKAHRARRASVAHPVRKGRRVKRAIAAYPVRTGHRVSLARTVRTV